MKGRMDGATSRLARSAAGRETMIVITVNTAADHTALTQWSWNLIQLNTQPDNKRHTEFMDQPATSPDAPICPDCAKVMALARTWPRVGGLLEMQTFQCKDCNVVFTEVVTGAAPIQERVTVLLLIATRE
jgi:hypothetical protein